MIKVHFTSSAKKEDTEAVLNAAAGQDDPPGCLMLFTAHENNYAPQELERALRTCTIPVFGASFRALIHEGTLHASGALVIAFDCPIYTHLFDISDPQGPAGVLTRYGPQLPTGAMELGAVLLADKYSLGLDAVLEWFFEHFGGTSTCLGAAAGTENSKQLNAVYSSKGVHVDTAIVAVMPVSIKTASAHGYSAKSRVVRVTSAADGLIRSLDTRAAADIYADLVSELVDIQVTVTALPSIASAFPLGIPVLGGKPVLRDVTNITSERALRVMSRIEVGAYLQVHSSEPEDLIGATRETLSAVRQPEDMAGVRVVFDCISRQEVLGEKFAEELDIIGSTPASVGALTGGELDFSGSGFPEFLNKTVTVGNFAPSRNCSSFPYEHQ